MKRIISLVFSVVLMLSLCIMVRAAGSSALNGNTSVTVGSNIEFTVNVTGCSDTTSIAVAVTYSDNFELVSGTWLKSGSITKFDTATNKGALGGLSSPDVNGSLFKVVLKAKTASVNNQTVSVNVIAKNGSNEIMNVTPSKSVKINCLTHSYRNYTNANTTNHTRTCSTCGNVETQAHTWNSGTVTKTANCKENGTKTYTCTAAGCGSTKTESIAKTNHHTYGSWSQTKAPNCTAKGTDSRICSTCQKIETKDIAATGHKMGSWSQTKAPSCTTKGAEQKECTVSGCSHVETRDIAATGHSLGSWKTTKEATCEANGKQTRNCSKCSHKETKDIESLGHKLSSPTVTKQPTCTEAGIESGKCTRCSKEITNTIKATGHKIDNYTVTIEPTCTTEGKIEGACTTCGSKAEDVTAAKGHSFGEPVVTKEATAIETGIKTATCTACGETKEEEIPYITVESETPSKDATTDDAVNANINNNVKTNNNMLWIIIAIGAVVLIGSGITAAMLIKKKR